MPTFHFNPSDYSPAIAALLSEPRLMPLGPGTPIAAVRLQLTAIEMSPVCRAGMWLYFDFLDESHQISQADEGNPERDFWHAIMHRREPDASNSKYWWRRVSAHPVLDLLRDHAPAVGYTYSTPEVFVDYCERIRDSGSVEEAVARRMQLLEWQLLFDWCYRMA